MSNFLDRTNQDYSYIQESAFVNNSNKFIAAISALKPNQIISVCELMAKNMPRIIKNKVDLMNVFKHQAPEQINAIFTAQKDFLLNQAVLETIRANISEKQGIF